eukprot:3445408-Amphidinium_carterae.1
MFVLVDRGLVVNKLASFEQESLLVRVLAWYQACYSPESLRLLGFRDIVWRPVLGPSRPHYKVTCRWAVVGSSGNVGTGNAAVHVRVGNPRPTTP